MNSINKQLTEYKHVGLGEVVMAIGGYYKFDKEVCISINGKELMYLSGYAIFDTTCCGSGGWGYALVYGFVEQWKVRKTSSGKSISLFTPIIDPTVQSKLTEIIKSKELVTQVLFK